MKAKLQTGFALPTVMIASVVMLMVLLSGLVAASATNTALREQYLTKVLKDANEAGSAMAKACLEKNANVITWNDASNVNLRPNTNCSGGAIAGQSQYLIEQRNSSNQVILRSTFRTESTSTDANNLNTVTIRSSVEQLRGSTGTVSESRSSSTPVRVKMTQWKDVVLVGGATAACALSYDAIVYCWGNNTYGQLGDGSNTTRQTAQPVKGNLRFKSIVTAQNSVCAIATTDYAYCWGQNYAGFLGVGDGNNKNEPTLVQAGPNSTGRWQKIALFNYSACGLSTEAQGYLYCWGTNNNYVYGNSSIPVGNVSYYPVRVNGAGFQNFGGGSHHVCGYAVGNPLYCWGLRVNSAANWFCRIPGEPDPVVVDCPGLGNRGFDTNPTSTGISTSGVTGFVSGSDEACLMNGGTAYCFGANFKGQSGDFGYGPDDGYGTVSNRAVPYRCVVNLAGTCMNFKSVTPGAFSFCGIDQNDDAWCWGMGQFGMHGDGNAGFTTTPTAGHVNDGASHTVLGSPAVVSSTFAVRVSGGMKFRKVFSLGFGFCGLNFTNELYCWGRAKNSIFGIQDGVARYYNYPTIAPSAMQSPPSAIIY